MDKKRGLKNVIVSISFKIILLVVSLLVRRFLIRFIGNEVNGLNSLYLSIIGFLAVAELGVGSAITFCMYEPIVNGDNDKVSALYHLFTKAYLIIGGLIFIAGCILIPFLPHFAADYKDIDQNLYLTFALMLISVVVTYVYSSKTSLINAYKNNYITTTISSLGQLLQNGLQILVLFLTKSFIWYLICRIIAAVAQGIVTEIYARFKYNYIIINKQKVDKETKKAVTKNIKAMFMHKIGNLLVSNVDSIIISAFLGVALLGKYSNYTTIMVSMTGVLTFFFTPLTSVIGHLFVEDTEATKRYFNFFHSFNYVIGVIFFLGYYAVIDNLIVICFDSSDLELSKSVSFIISLNYFVHFMRQTSFLFKDATGTFYNDRWRPIFEGVMNIGLSILFVHFFGIVGVIVATIITNLVICHIVEPHVLYKYALKSSPKKYYLLNYFYILIFTGALVILHFCMQHMESEWIEMIVNGCISIGISIVPCISAVILDKDFRYYLKVVLKKILSKIKRNKKTEPEEG